MSSTKDRAESPSMMRRAANAVGVTDPVAKATAKAEALKNQVMDAIEDQKIIITEFFESEKARILEEVQKIIDDQVMAAEELLKGKIDELTGQAADESAKLQDQIKAIGNFQSSMDAQVAKLQANVSGPSESRVQRAQEDGQQGGYIRGLIER